MTFSELPREYDAIILGTGVAESIVSGCLAQNGMKVLHLDKKLEYGGCRSSKGINDFMKWSEENGEIIVDKTQEKLQQPIRNYSYGFDFMPIVFYSQEKMIQLLIDSKAFQSLEFFLVEGLFYRSANGFKAIPSSKSSIFSDNSISLRQKRSLMKFLTFFLPESEYGHKTDTDDIKELIDSYNDKPFSELLDQLHLDVDLKNGFEYLAALANKPLTTNEAVPKIKHFCGSFGRWGPTPFISLAYGSADLPQVFCRYSAVYGSLFILNHFPNTIEKEEDGQFSVDINEIGKVHTKYLIGNPQHFENNGEKLLIAYRESLLISNKLLPEDRGVAVIAPNVLNNEKPVYIFQFDSRFKVCPEGQYVVHVSSIAPMREVVDKLCSELPEDSIILRVAFTLEEPIIKDQDGVIVVQSPTIEQLSFGSDFFFDQAKEILSKINPDLASPEKFYPKPTEVEVYVDEEEVNTTQEQNRSTPQEDVKSTENQNTQENTENPKTQENTEDPKTQENTEDPNTK